MDLRGKDDKKKRKKHGPVSLIEAQSDALRTLARMKRERASFDTGVHASWKVLVYDRRGRDILAPLMTVGDLRKEGVTLHMLLHSDRLPIDDVEALYFVKPARENLDRIVQDIKNEMYARFHLRFIGGISEDEMREFSESLCREGAPYSRIGTVQEQFSDFISILPNVFSQEFEGSFYRLSAPNVSEAAAEEMFVSMAKCLLSVCATKNSLPIIRAEPGGLAEEVAKHLNALIRENPLFRDHLSAPAPHERPSVIIMDRHSDLTIPLCHPWTYGPMLWDVLGMRGGRVTCHVHEESASKAHVSGDGTAEKKKEKKTFELDWRADAFLQRHGGSTFEIVADAVEKEVANYREEMDEIRKKTGISVEESEREMEKSEAVDPSLEFNTKGLQSTIRNLPELRDKKKRLDMHTTLAYALLDEIQTRGLDVFAALEESILMGSVVDKKAFKKLLIEAKEPTDKLRLFLVYYVYHQTRDASSFRDEIKDYTEMLMSAGVDMRAFEALKDVLKYVHGDLLGSSGMSETSSAPSSSYVFDLAGKAKESMRVLGAQLRTITTGSERSASEGVRMARIVRELVQLGSAAHRGGSGSSASGSGGSSSMSSASSAKVKETENMVFLDPRFSADVVDRIQPSMIPSKQFIVFVVGGGSLLEYFHIKDSIRNHSDVSLAYGATEILSSGTFLQQLQQLAGPSRSEESH
eukprot:TRINITY_DN1533_c0_g1_i1.p1 TRINITY_DN1533_c0_g1~~TRINITY_DN1533_c0_g1_i1.p1  ORF type:complete len:694 (+),score=220.46 TRINITY_DN1533_c0_g1_i1:110-2191(+)